jgi:hypothetical protein
MGRVLAWHEAHGWQRLGRHPDPPPAEYRTSRGVGFASDQSTRPSFKPASVWSTAAVARVGCPGARGSDSASMTRTGVARLIRHLRAAPSGRFKERWRATRVALRPRGATKGQRRKFNKWHNLRERIAELPISERGPWLLLSIFSHDRLRSRAGPGEEDGSVEVARRRTLPSVTAPGRPGPARTTKDGSLPIGRLEKSSTAVPLFGRESGLPPPFLPVAVDSPWSPERHRSPTSMRRDRSPARRDRRRRSVARSSPVGPGSSARMSLRGPEWG